MNNQNREQGKPSFFQRHKKKIIGGTIAAGVIGGGALLAKNKGTIGLGSHTSAKPSSATTKPKVNGGPDLNKPRVVGAHSNLADGWANQADKHVDNVLKMDPNKSDPKARAEAIKNTSKYTKLHVNHTLGELNRNDKGPVNRVNFKGAALWKAASKNKRQN